MLKKSDRKKLSSKTSTLINLENVEETGMEESDGQVMVNVMKKISHFIRNQKAQQLNV